MFKRIKEYFSKKPHTKAMYLTAIFSMILAISSITFSYLTIQTNQHEFELRMRPYLIITSISPEHESINQDYGTSRYNIDITNIGYIPAIIKNIDYIYNQGTDSQKINPHHYPNGIILGKDKTTSVSVIINGTKNLEVNVTVIINYMAALEEFSHNTYSTIGGFPHKFNEYNLLIIAGEMR